MQNSHQEGTRPKSPGKHQEGTRPKSPVNKGAKSRSMSNSDNEGKPDKGGGPRPKIRHDEADRLHRAFKLELDRQTHHLEEFFLLQCQMAEATLRAVEEQNRRSLKQHHDEKKAYSKERNYADMSDRQQDYQGNHDGQMANKIGRVVQKHLEEGPKRKTVISQFNNESQVQLLGPRSGSKSSMVKPPLQLPEVPEVPEVPNVPELPGQVPEDSDHHENDAQVEPASKEEDAEGGDAINKLTFKELQAQFGVVEKRSRKKRDFSGADTVSKSRFRLVCQSIVAHKRFEPAMSIILLSCAAVMAVESDAAIDAALSGKSLSGVSYTVLDRVFSVMFQLELILRWTADGFCFFFSCANTNIRWNYMDILLVCSGLTEDLGSLGASAGGVDMSSLRLLRMMRLVRVARIIRVVRFFSELRVMVYGIMGSAKSLLWALMLLTLVMFMASVTIMQLATLHLLDLADASITSDEKPVVFRDVKDYFGNLFRAMITLYMSIAGGIDWRDAVVPFREMGEMGTVLEILVCGYVFFTVFCCLNIVTGIFVDNAKALKQADEEHMFQEALSERKRWIVEVSELFAKVDEQNDGGFTYEVFREQLNDIRVQALFSKLGINTDTTSPEELWEILDTDNSGKIDQEEFAKGMRYFQGSARSIDVYRLRKDSQDLGVQLTELKGLIDMMKREMSRISAASGDGQPNMGCQEQFAMENKLVITKAGDAPPDAPMGTDFPRWEQAFKEPPQPSKEYLV